MNIKYLDDLLRGEKDKIIRKDIIEGALRDEEVSIRDIRSFMQFFIEFDEALLRYRHVTKATMAITNREFSEDNYCRIYEIGWVILEKEPMTPQERIKQLNQTQPKIRYNKGQRGYGAEASPRYGDGHQGSNVVGGQ